MLRLGDLALQCPPKITSILILLVGILDLYTLAYDPSMINNLNVVPVYLEHFALDESLIGLNVAIVAAGSIVSGPFVGTLLDRLGRKKGILVGAAIALVGSILQISAPNEACLLVGRFLLGLSLTISGTAVPMWVMELSPPKSRGIRVGIVMSSLPLAGFIVGGIVIGTYQINSNWSWRAVMMGELVGPAFVMVLMPLMPESPRWLISEGRKQEALTILAHLHGNKSQSDPIVVHEFKEICTAIEFEAQNHESWKALIHPAPNRRRFLIAVATNIFFQINGSNTVLYFLTVILANAGVVDVGMILYINLGICAFDSMSVWAGAYLIERIGRKPMLVWCTFAMTLTFAIMATLISQAEATGNPKLSYGAIGVMTIFLFGSCASWQILNYSYPQEVLKFSQRAKGTAVAQSIGYAFSFLSLYTFPRALTALSWRFYAVNGAWNLLIVVAIQVWFVETKGKSLEDMDLVFEPPTDIEGVRPRRSTWDVENSEKVGGSIKNIM